MCTDPNAMMLRALVVNLFLLRTLGTAPALDFRSTGA
jgi:hypothetical protein